MEAGSASDFDFNKLVLWFDTNLKQESIKEIDFNLTKIPLPPLKPHPRYYLKKGMGTGAKPTNKLLLISSLDAQSTATSALPEYGLTAPDVALHFSHSKLKSYMN